MKKGSSVKIIYILLCLALASTTLMFYAKGNDIMDFNTEFSWLLKVPETTYDKVINALGFGIIFLLINIFYLVVLKNNNKIFQNQKSMFKFIIIITLIFAFIIPFTTSDIFYYMGTGWIDTKYNQNPYYTTIREVRQNIADDEILQRSGVWEKQKFIYGPLWAFLCKTLISLSFGNATVGLYIFKLMAVLIHILNAVIIYKLANKKLFALMYGLNPFILFEMITNVHNDIYLVFFILLALYFLLKKKNILLSTICVGLAFTIKYVAILILPFIVIYHFRNEKIGKRFLKCIIYGLIFIITILLVYFLYVRDSSIFSIMMMQQDKYRESILFLILMLKRNVDIPILNTIQPHLKIVFLALFAIYYVFIVVKLLFTKEIKFKKMIQRYEFIVFIFLFGVITNLCPWYLLWLFPVMMWQKPGTIKNILYLSLGYELVTLINYALYSQSYKLGMAYLPLILAITLILRQINVEKIGGKIFEKISVN